MHLIHVIPRLQLAATYGAPPVDFLPYQVQLPACSPLPALPLPWVCAASSFAFGRLQASTGTRWIVPQHPAAEFLPTQRAASPLPWSPTPSPLPLPPFLPVQDPTAYEQLIKASEDFIARRALTHIGSITPQPVVHIVKVGRRCPRRLAWHAVERGSRDAWHVAPTAAAAAAAGGHAMRGAELRGRPLCGPHPHPAPSVPPCSTRSTPTASAT